MKIVQTKIIRPVARIGYFLAIASYFVNFRVFAANPELDKKINNLTPADSVLPMLLGLIGVLAIIVILALLLKKITGLNPASGHIKMIDSTRLGAKEKLVIVEIQQQQYVLGVTAHSISTVCQLQQPIVKKAPSMSFDKMMKQFLQPSQIKLNQTESTSSPELGEK